MSEQKTSAAMAPAGGLMHVADLLRCPRCCGDLALAPDHLTCSSCHKRYDVQDGIALLAVMGMEESWKGGPRQGRDSGENYQRAYQKTHKADAYNEDYKQRFFKRQSTRKEYSLLRQLLGSRERSRTLLDLPCGGGRLSPQMEDFTDFLVEADVGLGQLQHLRQHSTVKTPKALMTASAFHIPFKDNSVDAVVCCRLCHHFPNPEQRERLIDELLRVARRFVIMTFFDHHSLKNLLRRVRNQLRPQPPKRTMTIDQVTEAARRNGAELVASPSLFYLFSGHRYALMVKK
jgi:ubiquinone/menaquinone biosynthesis C-methylase UbiE